MISIRLLTKLNPDDLLRLTTGYISDAKYQASKRESEKLFSLTLELVPLRQPYYKRYDHLDQETLDYYRQLPTFGFSFGAYDEEQCLGIALAEPRHWNKSLWVWELHVAASCRQRGIGRQLVEALVEKGQTVWLRERWFMQSSQICLDKSQNCKVKGFPFCGRHLAAIDGNQRPRVQVFDDGPFAIWPVDFQPV
jgi:GNAT superfamily N-acetyltransferase